MSEITFSCTRCAPVSQSIRQGSDHGVALHYYLYSTFSSAYQYVMDPLVSARPFDPDSVMLGVVEDTCFAVYTTEGRLLAAGLRKGCEDLYLPNGVTCLHRECLANLRMKRLHLPSHVYFGERALEGLAAEEVLYPKDFCAPPYIVDRLFAGAALTSFTLWDGAERLLDATFAHCNNLQTVSLPNSLTYIGREVFFGCPRDLHIVFRGTRAQWEAIKKADAETQSEVHYDHSRVGHDWGAEYHLPAWIDFDTYTIECTEE